MQEGGNKVYPKVAHLPASKKMRYLVTGGAGFVGSHLVDRLMYQVCADLGHSCWTHLGVATVHQCPQRWKAVVNAYP